MTFGLLNVHKPVGPTSHDIVAAVRRGTGEKRVGHGGTLDPLAEGVLVLALGQATRLLEYASGHDKAYEARIVLGIETDSYDAEGAVVAENPLPSSLNSDDVNAALAAFRGAILQTPPVYSALKVNGKAAYERVRAGETVELTPRSVSIHSLHLTAFNPPWVDIYIHCSSGTYIRSLAHDIGRAIGSGAHLGELKRVASGHFSVSDSLPWPNLIQAFSDGSWSEYVIPPDALLIGKPVINLDVVNTERIANGLPVSAESVTAGLGCAYDPTGRFLAVVKGDVAARVWRPHKVFLESKS